MVIIDLIQHWFASILGAEGGQPTRVVRTHAEGDGGDNDLDPVLRPLQLDALAFSWCQCRMVVAAPNGIYSVRQV